LDIAPDFDGAAESDSSIDEMIYAMQNADLLDPFDSMAMIDVDFHEFGATVADEIDRYFQHSPLRLVGYWFDRGQTPKAAGLSLIKELTSSALTARPREESIASLVIGSNGGAVAHALLQLNAHNQVTILAFDKTSIHQARNIVPQATVVAGRESRLKLSADRFDLIVWVEGPDLRERERTLGQIRRALKPGGLFAATNLVSHSPVIPPAPFAEISDRYRAALEAAGLAHLRILDGTDLTWTRFLENSRAYFRTKLLFGELERDRYQSILRELPGGDDMVDAYVIVYASKPATEQS
jgi:SAM-dependent methyltransferase